MSFLSEVKRQYRNLIDGLKYARLAVRIATRINAEIQASNADAGLKTLSANFVTAATALLAAIEAFRDSLPGN